MRFFCHVHRGNIQIWQNIRHLASIDLKIPWQNLGSEIYATILMPQTILGDKKICVPYVQKLGETSPIAEYLPSCSLWTPKSTWRQGGFHEIHDARIQVCGSPCSRGFSKSSAATFHKRSMQVCGISRSWVLDSGLVAVFHRNPIAVYLKCTFAVFVILFGQSSALVRSSRFNNQTGRIAVLTREKV